MPPPPRAGPISVDVALRPEELVAAWRADTRRLQLPTREPVALQRPVAARIALAGRGVAATITGRAVSASRHGDVHRIELAPDELRVRAVERLVAIARGAPAGYARARAPRFLATLPAIVQGPVGATYMNTFSVSENGCGLAWSGPVPALDLPMDVRLGAGSRVASFRGVVCWTAQAGRSATVGVRFLDGARNAWAMMLGDVQRSGAPLA